MQNKYARSLCRILIGCINMELCPINSTNEMEKRLVFYKKQLEAMLSEIESEDDIAKDDENLHNEIMGQLVDQGY